MSDIRRIPFSASIGSDPWPEFGEDTAADLLQHLRIDNFALGRLRDALSADVESGAPVEATHA